MSLFKNAIESIELGVEDYKTRQPKRVASAVRNFYAGVLLLLKEKLRRESPSGSDEALLWERIEFVRGPSGVTFRGTGKKTVDVPQIRERFKTLGLVLDGARLEQLARIRNDVEHHSPRVPHATMQAAIANTFVLVTTILLEHLNEQPTEVFEPEIWRVMLDEAETYKAIEDRCNASVASLERVPEGAKRALSIIECPECDASLLEADGGTYFDATFTCRSCGAEHELQQVIVPAIASAYSGRAYEAAREGDEQPIGSCPSCGVEAFDVEADLCLVCSETRQYQECTRCEQPLSLDEQVHEGMCSYCQHMYDKVMAE